jgi:long-chain fatty acid transport protein
MKLQKLLLATLALTSTHAFATDGYFAHGYGVKAQGMGGVGIALPQDTLAAATNPAGMGLIGDRIDFGATWFRPIRDTEIVGNGVPGESADGRYKGNDTKNFIIPEFGYNKPINDQITLGVSIYGNGGMNTDYKTGIPLFNQDQRRTGVDLIQLFVAPTATWKISESNIVGISLNLAYQRFEAKGLQNFTAIVPRPYSSSPNNLTDNGHDDAYGVGLKFGWIGQLNDQVSVGATYQTKTYMSKFDKYKGLFAEAGGFDVPANYGVGLAFKATPALTIAADLERIEYGDVKSINNPLLPNLGTAPLGTSGGAGFGWRNVTVTKIGGSYAYSDCLTLRAGYNHSTQPIPNSETLFNMIAPGVVQDHLTLGATWTLSDKSELSFAYMHAFENSVKGSGSIPLGFGGGNANLKMYEDSIGVAYGWKL